MARVGTSDQGLDGWFRDDLLIAAYLDQRFGAQADAARATRIAARIGQGMAVLFGFAGLFGNPMLLLIALFVFMAAAGEAQMTTMAEAAREAGLKF